VRGLLVLSRSARPACLVEQFDVALTLERAQHTLINPMPTPGELVEVQVEQTDRGAWITSLHILGAAPAGQAPAPGRDREIRRMACLKAAATYAAGARIAGQDLKSSDVLRLAEAFETWVLKGGDATG
jgi:hypothetical protein